MKHSFAKIALIAGSIVSLIASGAPAVGGGGGDDDGKGGGDPYVPPVLVSCVAQNDAGENLCGHGIQSNGTTGRLEFINNVGDAKGGLSSAFVLDDGKYKLNDTSGINASGVAADGISKLKVDVASLEYDNVTLFNQSYKVGNTIYDVTGVTGLVTKDIPTSGTLVLRGDAYIAIATAAKGTDIYGKTTLTADFGSGKVDLNLHTFIAKDQTTGPIDAINVTGMTLSGSGFSGGTISTSLNGTEVDLVGANSTKSVAGHFYGADGANPDEAAGLLLLQGDSGIVTGQFIVD